MIAYLKGKVILKKEDHVIIENNGTGYKVFICPYYMENITTGQEVEIFISQSFSMYEGPLLYGFLSSEHLEIFELFKNSIPDTGSKKALEYLNKALKSITEFKKAILKNEPKLLTGVFGFTAKTAHKIISSLKDKISEPSETAIRTPLYDISKYDNVINALIALGYKTSVAKEVLKEIMSEADIKSLKIEEIIKIALRKINK